MGVCVWGRMWSVKAASASTTESSHRLQNLLCFKQGRHTHPVILALNCGTLVSIWRVLLPMVLQGRGTHPKTSLFPVSQADFHSLLGGRSHHRLLVLFQKRELERWQVIKNTCCSCRGPRLGPTCQHTTAPGALSYIKAKHSQSESKTKKTCLEEQIGGSHLQGEFPLICSTDHTLHRKMG